MMGYFVNKRIEAKGQSPGSIIFIGKQKMAKPDIKLIDYIHENLEERYIHDINEIAHCKDSDSVSWININGVHDTALIEKIGALFNIHELHLEEIANTAQRPRFEEAEGYCFFIYKMLFYDKESEKITSEQISFILGDKFLLTFQERVGDFFDPVRERIRKHSGKVREKSVDYLAYLLMDIIVDNYIILTESIGERIEELEHRLFEGSDKSIAHTILHYKMQINQLRKTIRPVRELVNHMIKSETELIVLKNLKYYKDLHEELIHGTEAIEIYHSIISDQLSIFNTNMSNRMNEVMKTLTIFASIFIPLTFVAGIYGMNFEYLPETKLKYGYLYFWIFILLVCTGMYIYFRRKKWF